AVQEQQRRQRLVLRPGRHVALGRKQGQERLDLPLPDLPRVALAIDQDETPDPAHVRLLRTQAVMLQPQPLPPLVEQLRRLNLPRYTLPIVPVTHTPSPWADNYLRVSHPAT